MVRPSRFLMTLLVAALAVAVVPAVAGANGVGTAITVQPATAQYSDYVLLKAQVSPAGLAGGVTFAVNGSTGGLVGAPVYRTSSGVAFQRYRVPLPQGEYSIDATFTATGEPVGEKGQGTLTVRPEDARIYFTSYHGMPLPWLMTTRANGRTAPFAVYCHIVEVPDGTPGNLNGGLGGGLMAADVPADTSPSDPPLSAPLRKLLPARQTTEFADYPEGAETGGYFAAVLLSNYYSAFGTHAIAIYDPRASMSAGAGQIVNPTNGNTGVFLFLRDPQDGGRTAFLYAEQQNESGFGMFATVIAAYVPDGICGAEFTDYRGNEVTVTERVPRLKGSADTLGVTFGPTDSPHFEDFSGARLVRGAIDLAPVQ